jgi:hypothetical protein
LLFSKVGQMEREANLERFGLGLDEDRRDFAGKQDLRVGERSHVT